MDREKSLKYKQNTFVFSMGAKSVASGGYKNFSQKHQFAPNSVILSSMAHSMRRREIPRRVHVSCV